MDIGEQFPEYDNMLAIDKICLENSLDTRAANLRRNIERPLEVILTIGMPIATYFLVKEGFIAPDPGVGRYALAALIGFVSGKALGTALGTIVNEIVDKEGEINQFYQKIMSYFSNNTNSRQAI